MTSKKKNLLVTGGAGFIGSNFINFIHKKYPDYNIQLLDALTYAGNLENMFRENLEAKDLERPNVIIVDPPRAGLHQKTVGDILERTPDRIIYVSCNPATQARDIALLCSEKYELKKLRPVDMFPHTPHVENVATLIRIKS